MKRIYHSPKMEIEQLETVDVVCASTNVTVEKTSIDTPRELPPLPVDALPN